MADFFDEPLLQRAFHHAAEFLKELPERHVGARATRDELMQALGGPLSDRGEAAADVIDRLAGQASRGAMGSAGPRFFGFVIGGSLPVALAADWLSAAWDQNTGLFSASPIVAVAEEVARGWMLELFGLPAGSGLGFTTGGQMSNFTCLAAARHGVLRKAGWNVEEDGLPGAPRIQVILGDEAHITIYVAMRMLGMGTHATKVPTDGQGRIVASELRKALAEASGPTIVCAQAGNVNTGAFDPLREIGEATREAGAWLHVDGAFGLWAAASSRRKSLIEGVELADSWATDAHKWLNVPYDCGVAIVRDAAAHRASMTSSAAYLEQTSGAERDPLDWAPEFSRRARGIPVYAALRALGREGVEQLVERCCNRAAQMASILQTAGSGVRILNDVVLNQVLVRFGDSDEVTRKVVAGVQNDGTCWLTGTRWHGMAAMRISVSNWATSEEDAARSAEAILRVSRASPLRA